MFPTSTTILSGAFRRSFGALGVLAPLLAACVTLGGAKDAHAQILSKPTFRLSAGGLPSPDGDVKRLVGSPYPLALAEISVPQLFGTNNYVGIGYGERRRDGNLFRVIPITLTHLYTPESAITRVTGYPYGGAGVALYLLRGRSGGQAGQNTQSDEQVAYGFTTIIGYQLPNAFFLEARYNAVTGSARSMSPGGLWLMAGFRL